MKYNRRIGLESTKEYLEMGVSMKELLNRRTGTSTACALEVIAKSLRNPGVAILIRDHYDSGQAHIRLSRLVGECIFNLKLDYFKVDSQSLTLTYNLYKEENNG